MQGGVVLVGVGLALFYGWWSGGLQLLTQQLTAAIRSGQPPGKKVAA